jgi:hypothetical protein
VVRRSYESDLLDQDDPNQAGASFVTFLDTDFLTDNPERR